MTPAEWLAAALVVGGTFFGLVATVGLIRLPDLYARLHSASKSDTLGSVMTLAGLAVVLGVETASVKLLFLVVFLFLTSPTAAHAIARAGMEQEVEPAGDQEVPWMDADEEADPSPDEEAPWVDADADGGEGT